MKILCSIFFCFFVFNINGQKFTTYRMADGLVNDAVNCLVIDQNDHVWFGTQNGLSFFDGTTWTNYNQSSHPDLIDNAITALDIDSDGNLWIGTDFGLNKFDGSNWVTYMETDGLADNRVKYINHTDETIWFANSAGITVFDKVSTWASYTSTDGLPFGGTNYITFDKEGDPLIGTPLAGMLYIFDSNINFITEMDGLLKNRVTSIAVDDGNNKWVGTSEGISVFNENNEHVVDYEFIFQLPPPDKINPIEDVQVDSKGNIWAGVYVDYLVTVGGVSMYDGSDWIQYEEKDGLAGPVVRRLAVDSKDNVWVATSTGVTLISDIESSIFDISGQGAVIIYPNFVNNKFTLEVEDNFIGSDFVIYTMQGQPVESRQINGRKTSISTSVLCSGVYLLVVDGSHSHKFIVAK